MLIAILAIVEFGDHMSLFSPNEFISLIYKITCAFTIYLDYWGFFEGVGGGGIINTFNKIDLLLVFINKLNLVISHELLDS